MNQTVIANMKSPVNKKLIYPRDGISKAEKDVVISPAKVKLINPLLLNESVITGNPAFLYSSPNASINSQKCGICQIKRYDAIKRISKSKGDLPAATHPATGGKAPTREPGIIAHEIFFFRGV